MNPTGCIQHNVIGLFAPIFTCAAFGPGPHLFAVALLVGLGILTRECLQRLRDFPGLTFSAALALNWTGPRPPHYRPETDAGRSPWDWCVQGYAPLPLGLISALALNL